MESPRAREVGASMGSLPTANHITTATRTFEATLANGAVALPTMAASTTTRGGTARTASRR